MTVREITVDSWIIELDNGENLRDLEVGEAVDLRGMTEKFDGQWIVAKWDSDHRNVATLQAAAWVTDCSGLEPGCQYAGNPHPHPVDTHGNLLPRPA